MIVLDKLLTGGVKFVLERLADTVDAELNDEDKLREHLLNAQMRYELGELSDEDFAATEADLLARLHEIQVRKREAAGGVRMGESGTRVTGVEVSFDGDE